MPDTAMTAATKRRSIARPLKILVPLIQEELTAGNEAGLEHYRYAGEMLLEAKEQVARGSWGRWLGKNFHLSDRTARVYMSLAREREINSGTGGAEPAPRSLKEFKGDTERSREQRRIWQPFETAARSVDVDTLAQEKQAREEEVKLHRDVAKELIELGYRALATRLHPDRGGSKEAMVRLNRVRDELKSIAETRRFL